MQRTLARALAGTVMVGLLGAAARGDEPAARETDRAAVRATGRDYVLAFNSGDAKAIAALWTENGEYQDESGGMIIGRAKIEAAYASLFKEKPGGKMQLDIKSIRFPSRDTAIEVGEAHVTPAGAELPTSSKYVALHVREDGKWRIAATREWGGNEDKLEDLAWLAGDWIAKSKDREVKMSFTWNAKKTFLTNRFSVSEGGKVTASGTQEIGRDPWTGQVCAWMFNEDGGRGQSHWSRDGNRWIMASVGVTADGAATSATNIITRVSEDEFTWRSVNRRVGTETSPDTAPMTVRRVKPKA